MGGLYGWVVRMHTVRVNLVRDLRNPPHCADSEHQRFKSIPTGSQDSETQFADSRDLNLQTPQRIGKSPHVTCPPWTPLDYSGDEVPRHYIIARLQLTMRHSQ